MKCFIKRVTATLVIFSFLFYSSFASALTLTPTVTMTTGYWNTVSMQFVNKNSTAVDLRNAVFQFDTPAQVADVHGDFSAISYPTINLTSTKLANNQFHNVVSLSLPTDAWVKSLLAPTKSITLVFGFSSLSGANGQPILPLVSDIKNISVTLNTAPIQNGTLIIKSPASPGSDVSSQTLNVTLSGNNTQKVFAMTWSSQLSVTNLPFGLYTVSSANVGQYVAPAQQQVNLNVNSYTVSLAAYTKPVAKTATVNITLPSAPVINSPAPSVFLQDVTAGTPAQSIVAAWNTPSVIKTLVPSDSYKVWAKNFSLNSVNYVPNYTDTSPFNFVADPNAIKNVSLSYKNVPLNVNYPVNLQVMGLPSGAHSVLITLRGSAGNVYTKDVTQGTPQTLNVLADSYVVSAANFTDSQNKIFIANSQNAVINAANANITVNYAPQVLNVYAPYIDYTLNVTWDNSLNALVPQDLSVVSQKSGVKNFSLAFIVSGGACTPSWGGSYPIGVFGAKSISNLRAIGGDVIISFGGAAGQELAETCTDPAALLKAYQSVITTYNVNKIDFDIEGAAQTNHAANQRRAVAIAQLQALYPNLQVSLTLPVLTTGLVYEGLGVLQDTIGSANTGLHPNIAYINIMAMDYGTGVSDMGAGAISAIQATAGQLKNYFPTKSNAELLKMVGVTPMIGVNDVSSEIFTLANAASLNTFAKQNQLPFIGMWSLNRDQQCAQGAVNYAQVNCSSILQSPYAFSQAFQK